METAVEVATPSLLRFQRHNGGLVMRAATVRAHIKDCARVISAQWAINVKGERAFSTRVINAIYCDEAAYWIPILRPDRTPVTEADGIMDKAIHVRGPRGEPLNGLAEQDILTIRLASQLCCQLASENDQGGQLFDHPAALLKSQRNGPGHATTRRHVTTSDRAALEAALAKLQKRAS